MKITAEKLAELRESKHYQRYLFEDADGNSVEITEDFCAANHWSINFNFMSKVLLSPSQKKTFDKMWDDAEVEHDKITSDAYLALKLVESVNLRAYLDAGCKVIGADAMVRKRAARDSNYEARILARENRSKAVAAAFWAALQMNDEQ